MDDFGPSPPVAPDATLEAAQEVAARRQTHWQRRPLSPGLSVLLWAMRVYVVLMLAVVAVQLLRLT